MDFTPSDLARIESVTSRALLAVAQFADDADRATFNQALFILGEVRAAAQFLCDDSTDPGTQAQIVERLLDLFQRPPLVLRRQPGLLCASAYKGLP